MKAFRPLSTSEQLVEHLRAEIVTGKLSGSMPGVKQIVQELGVNSVAVTKALKQLEGEGLVVPQGDRRSRLISKAAATRCTSLKVGILYYDATNVWRHDVSELKQALTDAGHIVINAPKNMMEMGIDANRTARLVQKVDVDAWIVYAGSRQILEWFEAYDKPAFALYGRNIQVSLASIGIKKKPVISTVINRLVGLGHSRIVMLTRKERRQPHLGSLEQSFIDELESHGIRTGSYNIPDWEDTPAGLEKIIDSLLKHTPPTALIIGDSVLFHAVHVHLASKGFIAPKDISLFCNDFELSFKWAQPEVSHIQWDYRPSIRRISQWANHIAEGKKDLKKSQTRAIFYEGGTIGPVPNNRSC